MLDCVAGFVDAFEQAVFGEAVHPEFQIKSDI
jgi:hypothetical protein